MKDLYVIPFWSYRHRDNHCIVTNRLTQKRNIVPPRLIDVLETVYNKSHKENLTPETRELLNEAKQLRIVFDSKNQAEAWYKEIESRWTEGFPIVDQIELTNRCPYTCKMCPRTTSMDRLLGNMDLALFRQIIEQVDGKQQYIGLHHFGESLLHPGLPEAVAIALKHGIQGGLSCNPPSLNPRLGARLLDAGIANMLFSFDSLDPSTYRNIRGSAANFERGDANLREFIRCRDRGNYNTYTTLQMINMYDNQNEADRFLEYCRDVGVDRGVVIQLGRWDFDNQYVDQLGEFHNPGYNGYCKFPRNSVVVLWDGRVVPCCHDYNGLLVFGNIREQCLQEIWESREAKKFRENHYHYKICHHCAFSRFYRERQQERENFRLFHRERENKKPKEWFNPDTRRHGDGRKLFDSFDII